MHFDQRTQAALRDAGLSRSDIREVSKAVVTATERDAETLESFFEGVETVYSDMEMAHSASEINDHRVDYLDLYTHGASIRGYLRFDSWGVPVEGGRPLSDDKVELALGDTVNARVRFARERGEL